MFRFWIHFPPFGVLAALLGLFAASGSIVHWSQCRSTLRKAFASRLLVAPFFVSVATIFALFAGFLLANVMAQKNHAQQAVQSEAQALLLLSVESATAARGGAAVREAIGAYGRAVVSREWLAMLQEQESPETRKALLDLLRTVQGEPVASEVKPSVHSQMLSLVQRVADARADRIATVTNHLQQLSWTALFLLGFLTQFTIGMVHCDRPAASGLAIGLFSLGAAIALWLIAIQDNPFRGPARVSPAPFESAVGSVLTV